MNENKRRFHNPAKGEADVKALGDFTVSNMMFLDEQATDTIRRRIVTNWFGHHGGLWAWNKYCAYRNRRRRSKATQTKP